MDYDAIRQGINPKYLTLFVFAALSSYLVIYLIYFSQWPIDDSFITMRIARNFSLFGRPYFNIDDPIIGASCHTWVLLLSAGFSIFGAKVSVVLGLEIITVLALFHYCAEILRERFSSLPSLLLAFFLVHVSVLQFAALLRETPLVFLFFCLTILSVTKKNYFYAGLFSGLAIFTRNEFVLFAAPLLWFHRKTPKFLYGHAAIGIIFLGYLLYFYKAVLPQALFAKALFASIPPTEKAIQMLIPAQQVGFETVTGFFFSTAHNHVVLQVFNLILPSLFVLMAALFLQRWRRIGQLYVSVAAFPLMLAACYLMNWAWIPIWYWPHVIFPLLLWGMMQIRQSFWLALACLIAGTGHLVQQANDFYALVTMQGEKHSLGPLTSRTIQYLEIGQQLKNLPDGCLTIYATEIGGLGWNFPGNIIDGLGLVSSGTFAEMRQTPHNFKKVVNLNTLSPLLRSDPPCLIVSLPNFVYLQLDKTIVSEALQNKYRTFSSTPLTFPIRGDKEIVVWQKIQ